MLSNCSEQFNKNIRNSYDSLTDSLFVNNSYKNYIYKTHRIENNVTIRYKIDSLTSYSDSLLNSEGFFIFYVKDLPWKTPIPFSELPISSVDLLRKAKIKTERFIDFKDYLRVYYIPNYNEDPYLINFSIRNIAEAEGSYLSLEKDSVMVDYRGRYCDKFGIHTYGHFGQERISDMLPYEYLETNK